MAENNETRFFYGLYPDKTWVFDQSERAQGPIYIIKLYNYEKLYNYYLFSPSINKDWLIDWLTERDSLAQMNSASLRCLS